MNYLAEYRIMTSNQRMSFTIISCMLFLKKMAAWLFMYLASYNHVSLYAISHQ